MRCGLHPQLFLALAECAKIPVPSFPITANGSVEAAGDTRPTARQIDATAMPIVGPTSSKRSGQKSLASHGCTRCVAAVSADNCLAADATNARAGAMAAWFGAHSFRCDPPLRPPLARKANMRGNR